MLKVDRRSLKSQEAIKKAVIELMSEKVLMTLRFRILLIKLMLIVERSICITWISTIYWISLLKSILRN